MQAASLGYAFIPMMFLFYFHYNIAMTPFYHLRTWGTAFRLVIAYTSLIIGLFANPVALRDLDWRYYIVFCVINGVFAVLVYLFSPETRGKTLEDIAEIFEGPRRGRDGEEVEKGGVDVEYLGEVGEVSGKRE
ncbi:hypothetical protein BJY00DRAFT_309288 [Aspergillus carlsbadensis]|nr:hypothetical protein BJY00DRAFT_309288 [Aspergillus carlsbadensis]